MIRVEHTNVFNFEGAIRGLRNPMNSWDKSDSGFGCNSKQCKDCGFKQDWCGFTADYVIGPNDLDLMKQLYKASLSGDNHAHRKYLRQISVSMDITAPLYWWKEFDTYKVGVTANSCSTMHKIAAKEFELDDFSFDNFDFYGEWKDPVTDVIDVCEKLRQAYLKTKDKSYWYLLIRLLPSSYNQRRTITMNYENAITIIKQRTNHKLDEWNDFVEVLHGLPYIDEIMGEEHPKHVQPDTLTKVNYSKDGMEEDLETIRKAGVRCCGTCQYYRIWNGVCVNGSSDYVADFVSLDFECEHWEEMKNT